MLGAIMAIIAGLSVKRLWPDGVVFLALWPAIAVAITLTIVAGNRAEYGEGLDITPVSLAASYAQAAAVTGIIFFLTYGIRRLVAGKSKPRRDTPDSASDQ